METVLVILYLVIGCLSTMWVEKILVEQGLGDELGLALPFGDRIRSIVLWPVFTGTYMLNFLILFFKNTSTITTEDDDQQ